MNVLKTIAFIVITIFGSVGCDNMSTLQEVEELPSEEEANEEGGSMEDDGPIDEETTDPDDGEETPEEEVNLYHPEGFAAPDQHGIAFNLSKENCQSCHGDDLKGSNNETSNATSCDSCHTPEDPVAWRTDCTFCHGGTSNETGAPPSNLDGTTEELIAGQFSKHTAHMNSLMATVECVDCHIVPETLLSEGHVLDDTPEAAEPNFSMGVDPMIAYDGTTCANSACHSNGQAENGTIADNANAAPLTCTSCHPGVASNVAELNQMSGDHRRHVQEDDMTCTNCHVMVTLDNLSVVNKDLHIDKLNQVNFTENTITWDPVQRRCTGPCHGRNHNNLAW